MTSNASSVVPPSGGNTTNLASEVNLPPQLNDAFSGGYVTEISIITVAISVILVIFLILFPKKQVG